MQSRLDYWLISSALQSQISNTNIKPAFGSDHSLLTLEIELHETPKRGKGTWKFNNQLLIDKQYVKQIRNTISMINKEVKFDNKNLFWEYLKCQIRTDTMICAGKKAKEQRQKEKELTQKIEELEHNVTSNKNEHLEYQQLKSECESIRMNKSNGIIIRSRAKWVEYGEKNLKYFLNLEKRNYNNKFIRKLITADEKEITNPSEILQEQFRFYADLYQTKLKNQSKAAGKNVFLDNTSIPELTQTDKDICDSPLTVTDLTNALKDMANDKSPGVDGFSTNFYKYFWNDLQQPLLDSFLYSFETGMLSDGQRRGLLNLIPKKDKDLRFLKSWRPVALLATDYKILAKALSLKMQKVISSLVHTDQVGYIKGTYIGENIRKIEDIINYTSLKNVPGTLALIDFQKAFDTVEWPWLFQTLKRFNSGECFISWIRLLYTNISSCVSNNGYISNYFTLTRGIRQGCPISALLFILVAEVLAINIRTNLNIKGLTTNNCEFKIAQLADDTTLFLADLDSLETAIEMFKNFGIVSGLKLNLDKMEVVPVGGMQFSKYNLARSIQEISIKTGPFRTLGVWFTTDMAASIDLNFGTRLRNMEQILYTWTSRSLSWKGKIVILKSLVIPQVTHLLSNTYVPNDVLDKIDRMLFKFLWQNGPSRVKRKTIINNLESGGLKMPDMYAFHTAQKCLWIKCLLDDNKKNWKALANELIGIDLNLLDH